MRLILLLLLFSVSLSAKDITLNSDNVVTLDMPFTQEYITEIIEKFHNQANNLLNRLSSNNELYLVIISPGGDIEAGYKLADTLKGIGYKVNTITVFAASMGFVTAQLLDKRYIINHGVLMAHKASGSFGVLEFPGQMDSRYNFWKQRIEDTDKEIIKRTNGKQTLESYNTLIENEYWCEGQRCIDAGFADELANVKCGYGLTGYETFTKKFSMLGMSMSLKLKRSKCPVNYGYEIIKADINNKPYEFNNLEINQKLKSLFNGFVKFNSN
jgi:ATP-dependent protease ClpP protease subunit